MKKSPTCPLCSGRMERHQEVVVEFATEGTAYTLAWVCTACSAAFPIAVSKSGLFKKPQPFYEEPTE
ncbi:hypothetical protein V5E97_11175 [Singulisphaera sp. Ch08]|uniref:Small CPxCG-related zinc finger protein n=1 Tax=Singulisphaera sp. Ch08 TaxID=3120278 RepID=A0AAU7CN89_9BACT